jgi:hypothetical protein
LSLFDFTPKFFKAHLNASFQNVNLELGAIYKSTSINPFQYAPQTNRAMVKAASSKLEEEHNKLNWRITNKDKKQVISVMEGVGRINSMEDVCMTCANMCGVQLAIVDILKTKPLLYQFAWKITKFIKNKKTKTWLCNNKESIAHLPMVFMGKINQIFQHLANFSQNSLNTNKVKLGNSDFKTRLVKTGVKLGAKFFNKMIEHVEDNLLPKDIPAFAKSLFVEQTAGGIITLVATNTNAKNQESAAVSGEGNKRKSNGNEPGKKISRKEFSDKSLKKGLFHIKKGTPAAKALPKKGSSRMKSVWISAHMRKSATIPTSSASTESITQTERMFLKRINLCYRLT